MNGSDACSLKSHIKNREGLEKKGLFCFGNWTTLVEGLSDTAVYLN